MACEITYNILKYHLWYLRQISLQIMLLPILISVLRYCFVHISPKSTLASTNGHLPSKASFFCPGGHIFCRLTLVKTSLQPPPLSGFLDLSLSGLLWRGSTVFLK